MQWLAELAEKFGEGKVRQNRDKCRPHEVFRRVVTQ
jgi:hypothetical protein